MNSTIHDVRALQPPDFSSSPGFVYRFSNRLVQSWYRKTAGVCSVAVPQEPVAFHRRGARRTVEAAMLPRRHLALSLATLATVGFASGCDGDSGDSGVMRATLSGDGCRYEGNTTPAPGAFVIDVRNDTNKAADFVLMMLPKGANLRDVETWFHRTSQTWQKTGKYILRPPISWVSSTRVAPHAASELPFNMYRRARLALLCAPRNQRPFDIIVAAELDVAPD